MERPWAALRILNKALHTAKALGSHPQVHRLAISNRPLISTEVVMEHRPHLRHHRRATSPVSNLTPTSAELPMSSEAQ